MTYQKFTEEIQDISRATYYRSIKQLIELGFLKIIVNGFSVNKIKICSEFQLIINDLEEI